jgi:AcrR family transcriptional regulator
MLIEKQGDMNTMPNQKLPRQVRTRMVKENILNTTAKIIREQGYDFVTVNNICQAAGVSTGSFYHHFGNKDELLAYFLVAAFEEHIEDFSAIQEENVVEDVLQCYRLYDAFLLKQGDTFIKNYYTTQNKALDTHSSRTPNVKLVAPIMYKTEELLRAAIKNGDVKPEIDPSALSEELCTVEKGVVFDWCLCDGAVDLMRLSERMLGVYLHAFLTPQYFERFPEQYKGL